MIGTTVYDVQNRDIGKVSDLVLDRDGKVAAVVVDVGSFLGMGGRNIAVQLSDLKTDNNRLTLDRTKEQLAQMPNYELSDRNTGAGTTTSPVTGGKVGSGR
jgi:sporulation protein YlmC with PRC-barrel domain